MTALADAGSRPSILMEWSWLLPLAAALCYPWTLVFCHRSLAAHGAMAGAGRVRVAHGVAALLLLLLFLASHLANHAAALLGSASHKAIMEVLRGFYRQRFVEAFLVADCLILAVTGLALVWPRMARPGDLLNALQTASGCYLGVFLLSHLNSVFVLARQAGVETGFDWATAAPTGLLRDEWSVRLIPHYTLAVWLLFVHLAAGLRGLLLAHGMAAGRAARVAWALAAAGTAITACIAAALLGARVNGQP